MRGPKYFHTNGHILLCQSASCLQRGADLLYQALWNDLERQHLAYYKAGGLVRLTSSGCLGSCQYGPSMCVYSRQVGHEGLSEAWYAAVDFPLAKRVAQAIQSGAELPLERRYDENCG